MITVERTTGTPPRAVFEHGVEARLCPWADLLPLRALIARVPVIERLGTQWRAEPRRTEPPWAISSAAHGVFLSHIAWDHPLAIEPSDWEQLRALLYVGDELLSIGDAAKRSGRKPPQVSNEIATGRLFAFQVSGLARRQWLVPATALIPRDELR